MKDILELMQTRYTTKHYDETRRVSDKDMEVLTEVLRLSPSSVNCQLWHFYLLDTKEAIKKLLPAVPDFNSERFKAPQLIIFTIPLTVDDAYWDKLYEQEKADGRYVGWTSPERPDALRRRSAEKLKDPQALNLYASNQVYLALGCLTVAAASLGVDSTILGGIDFAKVDEIMGLTAKGEHAVVGMALGYRAANDANATRPKSRWPKEKIISRFK